MTARVIAFLGSPTRAIHPGVGTWCSLAKGTTFFFVGSSTRTVTVEITYLQSSAPGSSAGGDISLTTPGYSQLQAFSVVDIIEITFTDVPAGQYLLAIAFERFTFGDPISSHTCMVSGTLDEISVDLFECAGIQP